MSDAELDQFLLGLLSYLASNQHVNSVRCSTGKAVGSRDIERWEQTHLKKLPEDLKLFYRTFDGFVVEWDVKLKDHVVNLGRIAISSLTQLKKTTAKEVEKLSLSANVKDGESPKQCTFDRKETADSLGSLYLLDSCECCGAVCLAFSGGGLVQNSSYSIQFMSKSGQWLYVASSLTNYLRLAVVHLGIQQWPLHLTTSCVSSHLRVWYSLFLLRPPLSASVPVDGSQKHLNVLNTAKLTALFNSTGRTPREERQEFQAKKRQNK